MQLLGLFIPPGLVFDLQEEYLQMVQRTLLLCSDTATLCLALIQNHVSFGGGCTAYAWMLFTLALVSFEFLPDFACSNAWHALPSSRVAARVQSSDRRMYA